MDGAAFTGFCERLLAVNELNGKLTFTKFAGGSGGVGFGGKFTIFCAISCNTQSGMRR